MDLVRALSAPFRDDDWPEKLVIAALLLLLPLIGPLLVLGWALHYAREVAEQRERALPTWRNWSEHLTLGLLGAVVSIAWFLPTLAVLALSALALLPALLGDERFRIISLALSLAGLSCLALPLAMLTTIVLPVPLGRLATTNQLSTALSVVGALQEARQVLPSLFVTWVVLLLHSLGQAVLVSIASQFALFLCLPGIAASVILATGLQAHQYLVLGHLTGQIRYRLEHPGEGAPGVA
ncbi:DUF4013 domain-containing protein [Thermomicrobium sp.]